jgi:hypothetical protein
LAGGTGLLGDQVVILYDFLGLTVDSANGGGTCNDQVDSVVGCNGVAAAAAGSATDQDEVAPITLLPLPLCSGLGGGTGRLGDQLVMEYDFLVAVASVLLVVLLLAAATGGHVLVYDDGIGGAGAGGADAVDHVGSAVAGTTVTAVGAKLSRYPLPLPLPVLPVCGDHCVIPYDDLPRPVRGAAFSVVSKDQWYGWTRVVVAVGGAGDVRAALLPLLQLLLLLVPPPLPAL